MEYGADLSRIGLTIGTLQKQPEDLLMPTKDEIKEFLTKQYGSTEDVLKLTSKQISAIEHPVGGKVTNLATLSGWENPGKLLLTNPSGFQAWVRWMYPENEDELKKRRTNPSFFGIQRYVVYVVLSHLSQYRVYRDDRPRVQIRVVWHAGGHSSIPLHQESCRG